MIYENLEFYKPQKIHDFEDEEVTKFDPQTIEKLEKIQNRPGMSLGRMAYLSKLNQGLIKRIIAGKCRKPGDVTIEKIRYFTENIDKIDKRNIINENIVQKFKDLIGKEGKAAIARRIGVSLTTIYTIHRGGKLTKRIYEKIYHYIKKIDGN